MANGIPTGNAGEYFVMGELLRRGLDAQLADRNTKGYDILVGREKDKTLRKVQIKSRKSDNNKSAKWYIMRRDFKSDSVSEFTIYVFIPKDLTCCVRYFVTRNSDLSQSLTGPSMWVEHGFMRMKDIAPYENCWNLLTQEA